MLHRAYTIVDFKTIDEERRTIEGVASTVSTDRAGDIVEPKGAVYKLPLPFMWQHGTDPFVGKTPVGHLVWAKPTDKGIPVRIQMERSDTPGRLKDILDFAWEAVKRKLVRGLSIGFNEIEGAGIKGGYGTRFTKWEWLELSAVTIPANAEASIVTIKSADAPHLARLGDRSRKASTPPAVVGSLSKDRSMNYSERRSAAQAELTQKKIDLDALMALDELTPEQETEADSLTSEVERLTSTVKRFSALEGVSLTESEPVAGRKAAPVQREKQTTITVEEPKLPPGVAFARMALCVLAAQHSTMKGMPLSPDTVAKTWYPSSERTRIAVKTAVAPATTTDSTWAGPLVYSETIADFVEYLRPRTIIGQFGQGNIPSMNRVPFNMRQLVESSAMSGYWVGQAAPKPLTKAGYTAQTLGPAKVAAITVDSEELLRFANHPTISAETAMRDGLTRGLVAKIDTSLVDPTSAANAGVNPASLTYGLSLGSSAGNTADDVTTDVLSLVAGVSAIGLGTTKNIDIRDIVLMMPPGVALALSLMTTTVGVRRFPDMTVNGGTLAGFPVLVSNYLARATYGNLVVAVVASEINLADDGQVTVDMSREASLEMNDAPTQSGTTGVSLVSLWQDNLVAFRAERFINWGLRRSGVVAALQSVNWGGVGSPV